MTTTTILWIMATMAIAFFLQVFFLPYIKNKWSFYIMSLRISQMAKKYDEETRTELNKIAKSLMELSKNERLGIDDDESE